VDGTLLPIFTGDKQKNDAFVAGNRGARSDILGLEFWGVRISEAVLQWSRSEWRFYYGIALI
jgi:hypothetical protein